MTIKHFLNTKVPEIEINQSIYTVGSYNYNWHKELELFWLLNGKVEINVNGKITKLVKNDLYLINSNVGHATFATDLSALAMRMHINPSFFIQQDIDLTNGKFDLFTNKEKDNLKFNELRYYMAKLYQEIEHSKNSFIINTIFYRITSIMMNFFVEDTKNQNLGLYLTEKNDVIKKVTHYIKNNFKSDISLNSLSAKFNYTPAYLSKIIKDELGINYYEYLTRCRLRHAVSNLTKEGKIGDIALQSGFTDVRAFNLMFKKHFGITPSQYRNKLVETDQIDNNFFKNELSNYEISIYETQLKSIIANYEETS